MNNQTRLEENCYIKPSENKSWLDKIELVISTKWFICVLIIFGIVFYIVTKNALMSQSITGAYRIFLEIINLLCGTAISTGILSFFLRITSMKKYITDTVVETYRSLSSSILNSDFNLNAYSDENLDKLKDRIIIRKTKIDINPDELKNSVYSLEDKLNNLLRGIYYEYHKATYWISPNNSKNTFKKNVELEYRIINNYHLKNFVKLSFEFLNNNEQNDDDRKKKVRFHEFSINGVPMIDEVPELISIENIDSDPNEQYDFRIIFKKELKDDKSHIVKLKYEYDVPMWDTTQSFILIYPCSIFDHKVFIDNKFEKDCYDYCNWRLKVNGFSSFYYPHSDQEKKFNVKANTDRNAEIIYLSWVLPGTGYVIYFDELKK